ncbi:hypothetical protein JCM10908_006260 [Rhodotorula pacifica]|uniref:uncharacterized protein n=1 Tax=Rhodotorula pacifica TaxID=1495444 RepID=UPI00317CF297
MVPMTNLANLEAALSTTLKDATPAAQAELRRLASYRAPAPSIEYPTNRLAAVLVLLHLNPRGELAVTLTTRSKHLRSHPGETALPGGRWEEGDGEGGEWTALREANEEIGLPLPPRPGHPQPTASDQIGTAAPLLYLTSLPAYSSRTLLVVLPVVYLLLAPAETASFSCLPSFLNPNPGEVDAIFHLPLRSFLLLPPSSSGEECSAEGGLSYTYTDYTWLLSRPYRLHAFSTPPSANTDSDSAPHSAVTGLTADIVLDVALLAQYGTLLDSGLPPNAVGFERRAQGQMEWSEIVDEALKVQKGAVNGSGARHERGLGAKVGGEGETVVDERTSAT